MNNKINSILFLLLLLNVFGCKEAPPIVPPPPPPPPVYNDTITVTVEGVTHRSITVNIKTTENNPKSTIKFFRIYNSNETQISEYSITLNDTSIIDDNFGNGLQLNTSYSYYAVRIDSIGERKDSSNIVQATTYDTTSHNYTWQEFIIGEWQSQLIDVWGTDENNVYAVGILTINGNYFSVLHYNGIQWIPVEDTVGGTSVFGFSENDVWIAGGGVYYFDGNSWNRKDAKSINSQLIPLDSVLFNNSPYTSIWGTSSNNVYFSNAGGKIIHWNGSNAEVVYSSTNILLTDIYGYSSNFILACGSALAPPSIALKYEGNIWNRINELNNNRLFYSVYINTPNEYYIVGQDVLRYRNGEWTDIISNSAVMNKIRGNKVTGEIAVVGHFSTLYHFNGFDWKEFQFTLTNYTPLNSVYLINNKIFAVGSFGDQARIIIGTRN